MSAMRGSTGSACGWLMSSAASAIALWLSACGAAPHRAEHAPGRAPETCRASETVAACQQRLAGFTQELEALVGPLASGSELPDPAAPATEVETLSEPREQPAPAPVEVGELQGAREATQSDQPECGSARDLRDRICELAAAICELAARTDAAPETKTMCESSRTSCAQARSRVAAACPD
jgi:hypothetical protein